MLFTVAILLVTVSFANAQSDKTERTIGIKTEKVKVEIAAENGWADYVFNNDYKLLKINELDNFIKLNKHLPEVPSTEEAIKNGIELKEMNILLLKKIEELTLYIIEQNKRIEKLENTQK